MKFHNHNYNKFIENDKKQELINLNKNLINEFNNEKSVVNVDKWRWLYNIMTMRKLRNMTYFFILRFQDFIYFSVQDIIIKSLVSIAFGYLLYNTYKFNDLYAAYMCLFIIAVGVLLIFLVLLDRIKNSSLFKFIYNFICCLNKKKIEIVIEDDETIIIPRRSMYDTLCCIYKINQVAPIEEEVKEIKIIEEEIKKEVIIDLNDDDDVFNNINFDDINKQYLSLDKTRGFRDMEDKNLNITSGMTNQFKERNRTRVFIPNNGLDRNPSILLNNINNANSNANTNNANSNANTYINYSTINDITKVLKDNSLILIPSDDTIKPVEIHNSNAFNETSNKNYLLIAKEFTLSDNIDDANNEENNK